MLCGGHLNAKFHKLTCLVACLVCGRTLITVTLKTAMTVSLMLFLSVILTLTLTQP